MPNAVDNYIDYFRSLAVSHSLLQHNPASEDENSDLYQQQRFACMGSSEILGAGRNGMLYPALIIELFSIKTSDQNKYDIQGQMEASFMVVAHSDANSIRGEQAAYSQTFSIMLDLLKKIWQDHYGPAANLCETPFSQITFTGDITPTGKLFQNEYGWYVNFNFRLQRQFIINEAPAEGAFL